MSFTLHRRIFLILCCQMSKINYELNTWFLYSIYFYGINLLQSPLTNFRVTTLEVQSFELRVLQIEKIPDVIAIHFFWNKYKSLCNIYTLFPQKVHHFWVMYCLITEWNQFVVSQEVLVEIFSGNIPKGTWHLFLLSDAHVRNPMPVSDQLFFSSWHRQ